ncbi:MAG TPA: tetratricopeptide repeat protein, partial [Rheinheimera sp.]|nr:tetratricopeptide repeat protein [Rheinheimera sp.]
MKANFLLISLLALTLTACSSKPDVDPSNTETAQTMYLQAKDVLDKGLYNRAIEVLKGVESRFPFGPLARQIQLDLIYAYYKA